MVIDDLTISIVRHGNTFAPGEEPRRIGARTDLPLVDSGIAQAQALGRAFASVRFDRALAAPLRRTRETMAAILASLPHAPAIETADWLAEIDHGPDEDRSEAAVVARIGQGALDAWDAQATVPNGWHVDTETRLAGWRDLYAAPGGHVLVVTSNGAARFALLADAAVQADLPSLKLRTGAYGTILRRDGRLRLVDWDRRP